MDDFNQKKKFGKSSPEYFRFIIVFFLIQFRLFIKLPFIAVNFILPNVASGADITTIQWSLLPLKAETLIVKYRFDASPTPPHRSMIEYFY
jgi:hypothetical protein